MAPLLWQQAWSWLHRRTRRRGRLPLGPTRFCDANGMLLDVYPSDAWKSDDDDWYLEEWEGDRE